MRSFLQSKRYLKQLLSITGASFLALCLIFTGFYSYKNSQNISHEISLTQAEASSKMLDSVSAFWTECSNTRMIFSTLHIPTSELETHRNYYALSLFLSLQESHLTPNSFFSNIELTLSNQVFFPTKLTHDRSIGTVRAFEILLPQSPAWPYEFDLAFSAKGSLNSVTLTANAYEISRSILSSGADQRNYYIAQDGTILFSNQTKCIFQSFYSVYPDLTVQNDREIHQTKYNDYLCTISPVDQYGFQLVSMSPLAEYHSLYASFLSQTLLLTGILLIIAVGLTVILANKVYQPINTMVKLLKAYTPDELQAYQSEIAFITNSIQLYAKEHKYTQLFLTRKLSEIQLAQAAALQNQINAHFLFNTLENIKTISTCELGVDNEVEKSIVLLNKIVHEAIVHKTSIISLSKEIELAQCYLQLMDLRFPGVQVSWDVPEQLLNCQIFKFSIQPILENCFVHAFRNYSSAHANAISIKISLKNEELEIMISDNGCGMRKEAKERLLASLHAQEEPDRSSHVGLKNIHTRIVAIYGENYGISIQDSTVGTTICMRYPAIMLQSMK